VGEKELEEILSHNTLILYQVKAEKSGRGRGMGYGQSK